MVWENIFDMLSKNGKLQNNIIPIGKIKSIIYIEHRWKRYTPKCYNFSVMGFFLCVHIKIFFVFSIFLARNMYFFNNQNFFSFQHEKFSEKFQVESHLWSHLQ